MAPGPKIVSCLPGWARRGTEERPVPSLGGEQLEGRSEGREGGEGRKMNGDWDEKNTSHGVKRGGFRPGKRGAQPQNHGGTWRHAKDGAKEGKGVSPPASADEQRLREQATSQTSG